MPGAWLLPAPETEERFRAELDRRARTGLVALAAVEVAIALVMVPLAGVVAPGILLAGIGLAAAVPTVRSYARAASVASVLCAAGVLLSFQRDFTPVALALTVMTAAAVPLRPIHSLGMSLAVAAGWLVWMPRAAAFAPVLTAAATGVSVLLYRQMRSGYDAQQRALETNEALAGAQLRAQLAENAAAIGKMAAALTHEINTPLGTLKSSVDTLLAAAERQVSDPSLDQERFRKLQSDLRRSIELSADRISAVVARLARFIALEEAELKPANVNELVSDVAVLFEEQMRGRVRLDFDLHPLPAVNCRPQQLTAVFSSLLSNAINAVNGDGHIVISTSLEDSEVHVKFRDNGRGMSAEELDNIFEPGFRVSESRVASGNWSLFNIRQIIFEHGGDIHIESAEGKGTTVSVTIPR